MVYRVVKMLSMEVLAKLDRQAGFELRGVKDRAESGHY